MTRLVSNDKVGEQSQGWLAITRLVSNPKVGELSQGW